MKALKRLLAFLYIIVLSLLYASVLISWLPYSIAVGFDKGDRMLEKVEGISKKLGYEKAVDTLFDLKEERNEREER